MKINKDERVIKNVNVKFQARDLTACILEQDGPSRVISVQMELVTMQWLTTNHLAFHPDLISPNVLEKLIKQHVKRVSSLFLITFRVVFDSE